MNMPEVSEQFIAKLKSIRLLVLDVDGVLTDGKLYFSEDGQEIKSFNTLDGHGIKLLRASGVEVGIITGRKTRVVARRAKDLGLTLVIQGREDKFTALQEMRQQFPCEPDGIAFMGDDYPDLSAMLQVGLALTVPNAVAAVRERAHWQSLNRGGEGAVREACDMIMRAQNTFDSALSHYLHSAER